MGGPPTGLRWEAIYPLMDRLGLSDEDWSDLLDDLGVMEAAAIDTIHEFAPKPKPTP